MISIALGLIGSAITRESAGAALACEYEFMIFQIDATEYADNWIAAVLSEDLDVFRRAQAASIKLVVLNVWILFASIR